MPKKEAKHNRITRRIVHHIKSIWLHVPKRCNLTIWRKLFAGKEQLEQAILALGFISLVKVERTFVLRLHELGYDRDN